MTKSALRGLMITVASTLWVLMFSGVAGADFYVPQPTRTDWILSAVVILSFESLFLGIALHWFGFYRLRIILVWTGVTFLTWLCFVAYCAGVRKLGLTSGFTVMIVVGEIVVVYCEALILERLSTMSLFRRTPEKPISWGAALLLSLLANLLSIVAGLLWLEFSLSHPQV